MIAKWLAETCRSARALSSHGLLFVSGPSSLEYMRNRRQEINAEPGQLYKCDSLLQTPCGRRMKIVPRKIETIWKATNASLLKIKYYKY
jgi:hypothetical protein